MLHIRVLSPPGVTGRLLDQLASLPGIENLIVLEGAGHRPDGDAVLLDVRDNAANPVFRMLRDLGLDHDNPIAVELVDATIHRSAVYSPSFFILLTIAGLIGAVGILTNSEILIVGAMVVGPEYNAIIAAALGISKRGPQGGA